MLQQRLKNEVEFRVARWILLGLLKEQKITRDEFETLMLDLVAQLNPLTKSVEKGDWNDGECN